MSKKKKSKRKQKNYTKLDQHEFVKKKLIPPFMQIPNLKNTSWRDDRLPEMLWAALLLNGIERNEALGILRNGINFLLRGEEEGLPQTITHSKLALSDITILKGFISTICVSPIARQALRPLLLFENLPGFDYWREEINLSPTSKDWEVLFTTILNCTDHQSQMSTDCRWLKVVFGVLTKKLNFPDRESINEIIYYPDYGDMRKVRPSIRSSEIIIDIEGEVGEWPKSFWTDCLRQTDCIRIDKKKIEVSASTKLEIVDNVIKLFNEHCASTIFNTDINAKHDSVFGFAFYGLNILRELLVLNSSRSIIGRIALRSLFECYITLKYLVYKDNDETWNQYRNFGAGQNKLAFLKLDELENIPEFVDIEHLEFLANEDVWQEFLTINLGNWDNKNLRLISTEIDEKELYDMYYIITSGYVHGNWGAVRDAVFETCFNPLHRFHRIAKREIVLNDVVPDAVIFVDKILEIVDQLYPDFKYRTLLK
ncbi:MAG: hypothetical protein K0S61_4310 [Anaerocolumna sp.]|nr:hypothetical protein [Anaerocolumna sp.]